MRGLGYGVTEDASAQSDSDEISGHQNGNGKESRFGIDQGLSYDVCDNLQAFASLTRGSFYSVLTSQSRMC